LLVFFSQEVFRTYQSQRTRSPFAKNGLSYPSCVWVLISLVSRVSFSLSYCRTLFLSLSSLFSFTFRFSFFSQTHPCESAHFVPRALCWAGLPHPFPAAATLPFRFGYPEVAACANLFDRFSRSLPLKLTSGGSTRETCICCTVNSRGLDFRTRCVETRAHSLQRALVDFCFVCSFLMASQLCTQPFIRATYLPLSSRA